MIILMPTGKFQKNKVTGTFLQENMGEVIAPMELRAAKELPSAIENLPNILARGRGIAVFLDYDGVLSPIVPRPENALLSRQMRQVIERLAGKCTVSIVSGRDLADVLNLVDLRGITFAGSHGFDIVNLDTGLELTKGMEHLPALDQAERRLAEKISGIPGARLERKRFAIAVHYREVPPARQHEVQDAVQETASAIPGVRVTGGKKILELRPDMDWDKGRAVAYLLDHQEVPSWVLPIYLGDDLTDEDAFRQLHGRGVGIYVGEEDRPTAATYTLKNVEEVRVFLDGLASGLNSLENSC